jgi:hypothetical protein
MALNMKNDFEGLIRRPVLNRIAVIIVVGISCVSINGCMYRGEGVFKQIGTSDYKARLNLQNMLVAADGNPTNITGNVVLDDMFTPLKNTLVVLRKKDQQKVITSVNTDSAGRFTLSGLFSNDDYTIEIDSREYSAFKTILVEPNRINNHEIFARKK